MIVIFTLSPALEPLDVTLLRLVVVRIDLRPELHLLDDRVGLVAPGLTLLHGSFVLEFPEVHELANRRLRHRSHLDEVEVRFYGEAERILDADDPHLLAIWSDESDLRHADPVIDPWLDADGGSLLEVMGRDLPEESRRPLSQRAQRSRHRVANVPKGRSPHSRPNEPHATTRLLLLHQGDSWVGAEAPLARPDHEGRVNQCGQYQNIWRHGNPTSLSGSPQ
jgi:hypothetical protein